MMVFALFFLFMFPIKIWFYSKKSYHDLQNKYSFLALILQNKNANLLSDCMRCSAQEVCCFSRQLCCAQLVCENCEKEQFCWNKKTFYEKMLSKKTEYRTIYTSKVVKRFALVDQISNTHITTGFAKRCF